MTFEPGYFIEPIYTPTTWPPGFVPTLFETWGHKSANASMAASANRDKRVESGCLHSLGSIDMPGTPTTPAPKPINRTRSKGSVSSAIVALCTRPQGATTNELAEHLGMSKDHAGQRMAFFAREQVRMKKTPIVQVPTGYRKERRYFLGQRAADAFLLAQQTAKDAK